MFKGALSDLVENIKKRSQTCSRLSRKTKTLKDKLEQKTSIQLKADFILWYSLLHVTSGDPHVMVGRITRTSNLDSGAVTVLEIWRHMRHRCAGSAKTRTVSLLKQIMSPAESNVEESKDVIQQYYHWLKLISKYDQSAAKRSQTQSKSHWHFTMSEAISFSL